MKRNRLNATVCSFFLCILSLSPHSSSAKDTRTSLVRIPYKSPAQVRSILERGMDVLSFSREGYIDVAADPRQLEDLYLTGAPVSVIGVPGMALGSPALDANLGLYHTYAEMESVLTALQTGYPALASMQSIGSSHEGRYIYALKVSDNVGMDEAEPEVLIMGNHHARELMSVEIPLLFAEYLLANYGSLSEVTNLVDTREIYFVPMVNPDGHYYVQQNHSGDWWNWWRKNRRNNGDGTYGVDLNRNYSYQWGFDDFGSSPVTSSPVYRGPAPFSEPETQAIRDYCASRDFRLSFSYHSYGELLLYPWAYCFGYTPDHDLFLALGDTLTSSNGYFPGNSAMGAIYLVNGDTDDWAYGEEIQKNRFYSFTPEVNSYAEGGFGPPDTLIQPTFSKLLPMNMLLLELAGNPRSLLGPYVPTMYAIEDPYHPIFTLSWSGNHPADSNPVVSYELVEYKNLTTIPEDAAESMSPLWNFDGFLIGARAHEGSGSYYSDNGNNLANHLETAAFHRVTEASDTFTCWVWYDIEPDYDYAYCEVSTDDGLTWTTVPGTITTNFNPYGSNRGNGITGASGGWIEATFPLDSYLNQDILLRLSYITDGYVSEEGIYFDLLGPVPTYEHRLTVGSAITDTTYLVVPSETGEFTYRVRAKDSEGHLSRWSGSVSIQIDDVTSATSQPPLESQLGANYPNPFNPVTRIPFTVGSEGVIGEVHVTLKIYSVSGAHVATLIDENFPPGHYREQWVGKDDSGRAVASGVYFVRMTVANGQSLTRKLVLLK